MGNSNSKTDTKAAPEEVPPMPPGPELQELFLKSLEEANLPSAEFVKLNALPDERKWQLVLDHRKKKSMVRCPSCAFLSCRADCAVAGQHPPEYYLSLLKRHLEPDIRKRKQRKKRLPKEIVPADVVLKDLEISLRTNSLSWVKTFVDEPNSGFHVVMEYLVSLDLSDESNHRDRYLCITCLKALMNNAYGFEHVMALPTSIENLVMCLRSPDSKTKVLVLDLLGAVCLVGEQDGHTRTLQALDSLKVASGATHRFRFLVDEANNDDNTYVFARMRTRAHARAASSCRRPRSPSSTWSCTRPATSTFAFTCSTTLHCLALRPFSSA